MIAPSAIIDQKSKIGKNVTIGNHSIIYSDVVISDNVQIADNCIIGQRPKNIPQSGTKIKINKTKTKIGIGTIIGSGVIIYATTAIGKGCLIADLAAIRESCRIGDKTIIGRSCTIENNTKIGDLCKIQTAAHITGNAVIKNHVFIGPHVTTTNDKYMGGRKVVLVGPKIEKGAKIGANATLLPGIRIGAFSVVGAGSVVTKDVPCQKLVVGVPAKPISKTI